MILPPTHAEFRDYTIVLHSRYFKSRKKKSYNKGTHVKLLRSNIMTESYNTNLEIRKDYKFLERKWSIIQKFHHVVIFVIYPT